MESKLVLGDHNKSEEVQKLLDKEGYRRFINYLIKSFISFVQEVYERIQREKLEKGSDTNPA